MRANERPARLVGPRAHILAVAPPLAVLFSTSSARAYDAIVDATTAGQAYQLRGPSGDPVLSRRRVTQTLSLGVHNLLEDDRPGAPQLHFRVRMRLDADFGITRDEYQVDNLTRFVPGLTPAPVDLMYGYLEGQRFARGYLGFRVGRQYVVDPLGYYAFDGAQIRVTTPAYVAAEAYAGYEARAGLPLSTGRWELGGIQRGSRSDYPPSGYPSYQEASPAPLLAFALESAGPTWIHSRLTYRKVWNTGSSFVAGGGALLGPDQAGAYDKRRVSSERLGYGASAEIGDLASVRGAVAYDLYGKQWTSVEGGVDAFVHRRVTVGADYSYWRPLFDGDSIFNVFGLQPMDDFAARIEVEPIDHLQLEADARVRRYKSDRTADVTRVASSYAPGGGLRARYRWGAAQAGFRGTVLTGDQGNRYGGDATYARTILDRYLVDARVSLWRFEDKLRTDAQGASRSATSVGYVLGAGYRLSQEANALLEFEHDVNRLVGQRFRLLAVFHMKVWL